MPCQLFTVNSSKSGDANAFCSIVRNGDLDTLFGILTAYYKMNRISHRALFSCEGVFLDDA